MSTTVQPEQAMSALAKANLVRLARAKLLSRLIGLSSHDGCEMAAEIIIDPPDVMARMEIADLLVKVRRFGTPTVERMLATLKISELKRLEDLTPNQRSLLVGALQYRAEFAGTVGGGQREAA